MPKIDFMKKVKGLVPAKVGGEKREASEVRRAKPFGKRNLADVKGIGNARKIG